MQVAPDVNAEPDILLIGGGLANGLLLLRLSQLRPDLDVRMVEAGDTLGGVHTWSFFETDLTPAQNAWIAGPATTFAFPVTPGGSRPAIAA
jgi:lycopene beta-cyclase